MVDITSWVKYIINRLQLSGLLLLLLLPGLLAIFINRVFLVFRGGEGGKGEVSQHIYNDLPCLARACK